MIVPDVFVQQNEFESAVASVEQMLSSQVVRIRYTFKNDWTGEPAVFFRVTLSDAASKPDQLLTVTDYISNTIEEKIKPLERWGLLPYFNFRSQSEQNRLNEPAWA